jgi:predicted metalloprotease with PDZ domain
MEPICYTVSMLRASAHYFDVVMEVQTTGSQQDGLRLAMPVWTPGHYMVEDFARHVDLVRAYDASTKRELPVAKLQKSDWTVDIHGATKVRIEYAVYAFSYGVDTSYIDNLHALINGASVFLYAEGMKGNRVRVKLEPLPDWKVVSTGLERISDWEFEAPDYDVLVDSPMEIGNQEVSGFDAGGTHYEVSMFGTMIGGEERFVSDLRRIVNAAVEVFDHIPFKRYVFIVNFTDTTRGGLEHLNSTVCFLQRFRMLPVEEYNFAMALFSHEFFHAWNVKRLKPVNLGPFDYSAEVYTKSLWIAEGITSYYDDLILRRAGLYSVEEYLDAFALNISQIKSLAGSKHQSAEEASFDTWVKYYKQDENSPNVTSSYYAQGAVIGWMLDMVMRKVGRGNLDDAMRKVYAETYLKDGRGYSDEEFERACLSLGGEEAKVIFESRVRGREEVDFDRYLGYAGLRLAPKEESSQDKGFLGVKLGSGEGGTMIKVCLSGSPAQAMGLSVNDEVIALGGLRVNRDKLSFYIGAAKPGEMIGLSVIRNGMLMNVEGRLVSRPTFEYRIQARPQATSEQRQLFKGWMLADWKAELKYPEYTRSPDRPRVFDYV